MSLPRGSHVQAVGRPTTSNSKKLAQAALTSAQAFSSNADNLTIGTVQVDQLPLATATTPGIVQPDEVTITVDIDGIISTIAPDNLITVTAGANLSGHTVVTINSSALAVNPSISTLSDGLGSIGITIGAIAISATGPVQIGGELIEPSWTWTPGSLIWADDVGSLTQSLPSGKWLLQMGIATSATSMIINPTIVISTPL